MTGRRALVTGATGFVGRGAVDRLRARGYDVSGVSRRAGTAADLLDPIQAERVIADLRPTHLLHLAWCTEHGRYWDSPENVVWLEASLRLVRLFIAHGGRRLVVAGSCAEYYADGGVCAESETPVAPSTLYASCKHALNVAAASLAAHAGVSAGWARIFNVFGPGEQPARLVPSVIRQLARGEAVACSDGRQVRDYLPVDQVSDALAALVDSSVEGAVNVGSGVGITVRELAERLAGLVGSRELLRFGALPRRAGEPDVLVADIERLSREVGWTPAVDFTAALRRTVSWWLSQPPPGRAASALVS
jgi:nucleoside-diphosphate-sugar epimerase